MSATCELTIHGEREWDASWIIGLRDARSVVGFVGTRQSGAANLWRIVRRRGERSEVRKNGLDANRAVWPLHKERLARHGEPKRDIMFDVMWSIQLGPELSLGSKISTRVDTPSRPTP